MRLQLIAAALAVAWGAAPAFAQETERGDGSAGSTLAVYSDSDATTVVTSVTEADVAVADDVVVGAHVLIDAVSTASVDVVSSATPHFSETRVESGGKIEFPAPRALEASLAVVHSEENDWSSNALQASLARELAQKNTRLSASYGIVGNTVGRSGDPTFQEHLSVQTLELGVTQLIDRRTLAAVTYTGQVSDGFHSSPYRYVSTTDGATTVLESHPRSRTRHALSIRGARYMWSDTSVDLEYRFYRDDWGMLSHTLQSSLHYAPGDEWDLRLRARFYIQGAARFWRMRYDDPMKYMSADRELSTFWDVGGGARLARRFGRVVADAKLDVIRYRFLEFEALDVRSAIVAAGGLSYQW